MHSKNVERGRRKLERVGESERAKVKMDLWIAQFISLIPSLYATFSWMHKDFEYTCFMFKHFFGIRSSYWERKEIFSFLGNKSAEQFSSKINISVFVAGDNRDNSTDSRFAQAARGVGFVERKDIVGRADRVMFSSAGRSMFAFWTWRSDRFYKALD